MEVTMESSRKRSKGVDGANVLSVPGLSAEDDWLDKLVVQLKETSRQTLRCWNVIDTRAFDNGRFVVVGYYHYHSWRDSNCIHVESDISSKQVVRVSMGGLTITADRSDRPAPMCTVSAFVSYIRKLDRYQSCTGRSNSQDQEALRSLVAETYVQKSDEELQMLKGFPVSQPVVSAKANVKTGQLFYSIERKTGSTDLTLRSYKCLGLTQNGVGCNECSAAYKIVSRKFRRTNQKQQQQVAEPAVVDHPVGTVAAKISSAHSKEQDEAMLIKSFCNVSTRVGKVPLQLAQPIVTKLRLELRRSKEKLSQLRNENQPDEKMKQEQPQSLLAQRREIENDLERMYGNVLSAFERHDSYIETTSFLDLLRDQIKLYKLILRSEKKNGGQLNKTLQGMRWSDAVINFCVQWRAQFGGPGIRALRSLFMLPSDRMLRKRQLLILSNQEQDEQQQEQQEQPQQHGLLQHATLVMEETTQQQQLAQQQQQQQHQQHIFSSLTN